ncbi:MAG: hypothetical protein CMK09_10015 [Ponticaulis sp.]|nr:hypothetical protein [Ponticaulis sp.]|tara:strand:+ start:19967 stop:22210 length:2244 start_codon:yes stop_codon:yes gene_type:complete
MTVFRIAIVQLYLVLTSLTSVYAQTTEETAEAAIAELPDLSGEDFIAETEAILTKWDELGGSSSNYIDAARTVVTEIDRFIEESGAEPGDLPVPVGALQMVALNYSGGESASGLSFSPDAALAVYDTGIVTTRWGPPVSYRGEYQRIMKRIYMEMWNRSSLDGLVGEEAPTAYAKMLFDVHDAPNLCEAGEAIFWSCADEDRDRYLSVCGSGTSDRATSWVQYRVGKPGDLELTYPETKAPNFTSEEAMMAGEGHFSRDIWRYGGSTLEFTNGDYNYAIEDEIFTDTAVVSVIRNEERVFELTCKTTHPFMSTIGGHLWGGRNDDQLQIVPGARPDVGATACKAQEDVVWSCLDTRDQSINSVCSVPVSGEPGFVYRKADQTGTVTNSAYVDDPVPASSDLIWLRDEPGLKGIAIGDFAERHHFTSNPDGTGEFMWSKNEGERSYTQSCSVTHDNLSDYMPEKAETVAPTETRLTYEPQPILYGGENGTLSPSPEAFDSLILQLKGLEAAGHFKAGAGLEPLDVLGGEAAIPFALKHRADDFRCHADHGGICAAPDDLYSYKAFFIAFSGFSDGYWYSAEAARQKTRADIDLSKIALSFAELSPPGTPVVRDEFGFCQARAYFKDWDAGIEMYQSAAEQLNLQNNTDHDWLWSSFKGVISRYNVRAAPDASAEIVGHAENEAIHFPDFDAVTEGGGYTWREVVLPDGTTGFIAASDKDILEIDDAGQVCARIENGVVKLTQNAIGGD